MGRTTKKANIEPKMLRWLENSTGMKHTVRHIETVWYMNAIFFGKCVYIVHIYI